jgi:hypothetical protein
VDPASGSPRQFPKSRTTISKSGATKSKAGATKSKSGATKSKSRDRPQIEPFQRVAIGIELKSLEFLARSTAPGELSARAGVDKF